MKKISDKSYEIDMCSGSILGKVLVFSLPLMLSGVLQLLFNAADVIVVGRFAGSQSLAAVGSTSSLINLLINLFIGLSVGVNVLVAKYYGAKEEEENVVSVRSRYLGDEGQKSLDTFINDICKEIRTKEIRKIEVEENK